MVNFDIGRFLGDQTEWTEYDGALQWMSWWMKELSWLPLIYTHVCLYAQTWWVFSFWSRLNEALAFCAYLMFLVWFLLKYLLERDFTISMPPGTDSSEASNWSANESYIFLITFSRFSNASWEKKYSPEKRHCSCYISKSRSVADSRSLGRIFKYSSCS